MPLLSPGYFARSWPGREWACYLQRLERAGVRQPDRRFAPVLWIPLPGDQGRPGLRDALALGESEPEYAENGLRALLRLAPYRASYRLIVERLAARIVDLAQNEPLPASGALDIDEVPSAFYHGTDAAVFAIAVAAPTAADVPAARPRAGYGKRSIDWRAYPDEQELPLVEYAAQVAEQLDFAVAVTDSEKIADLPATVPGIILIDPWFASDERGLEAIRSFASGLPPWVLPLLVLEPVANAHAVDLAERVRAILSQAEVVRNQTSKLRRYTARPGSRPRLVGEEWPHKLSARSPEEKDD